MGKGLRYFPNPFTFREPEGESGFPTIVDAKGFTVAHLFWPTHPPEETTQAEQETYALGRVMASVAACPLTADHARAIQYLVEVHRRFHRHLMGADHAATAEEAARIIRELTTSLTPHRASAQE